MSSYELLEINLSAINWQRLKLRYYAVVDPGAGITS